MGEHSIETFHETFHEISNEFIQKFKQEYDENQLLQSRQNQERGNKKSRIYLDEVMLKMIRTSLK